MNRRKKKEASQQVLGVLSADQWPHSHGQSNPSMELTTCVGIKSRLQNTNHFVYSAPLIALMCVFSKTIPSSSPFSTSERCILNVPVRTREWCGDRKLPHSVTHSLTLSVFTAFSASQPNNKLRRRAPLPYRRQQHKSVLLQWFSGNRSVRRERLWLRLLQHLHAI